VPKHTLLVAALLALSAATAPACAHTASPVSSRASAGATTSQPPPIVLLDRTEASFRRWRHVGGGAFVRNADGSIETKNGPLGMLWYPDLPLRDVVVHLQWRDMAARCCSNSGVFVRFPDPESPTGPSPVLPCRRGPAANRPEWVAIYCGQEVQINDGDRDPQKTGSIYNFKPVRRSSSPSGMRGTWNDLSIEINGNGDYTVTVTANGRVINTFTNSPGQQPMRRGDPSTDDRQFAVGYLGLQNHEPGDVVQFRDITATLLTPGGVVSE
jgi:hypothetical protein